MSEWLNSLRTRLRALFRRRQLDRDFEDEVAFHLAMREKQLREAGNAEAGRFAHGHFGSRARIREELRDTWALAPRIHSLLQDLRYAARTLGRSRTYATVMILTLGFGIGINTATFSIVNAVLLRPLGFPEPERLVMLHERLAGFDFERAPFSPPDFVDLQREQQSFERVAVYRSISTELSGNGGPSVRLDAARVSADLFPLLGVAPAFGRGFTNDDDRPGVDVVILSWGLWQARYAADPAIVGRTIVIDRRPYTVVGVMPAAFEFPHRGPGLNDKPAGLWIPMAFTDRQRQARGNEFSYAALGRLKPEVTLEAAQAELDALAARIDAAYPPGLKNAGFSIAFSAAPFRNAIAGNVERPLLLLLAAVGLVLLVTCANVANLVLSRVTSRTRELSVRAALGSSRGRLVQLLVSEAALLSAGGAIVGLVLSRLIVMAVPASVLETLPFATEVPMDGRVLSFAALAAIVTALLFAIAPVVAADPRAPGAALQDHGTRTTPGRRRHRMQASLVVSTVTLAVVLLVGAGLFIRSFVALLATDPGFNPDRVLAVSITLPPAGYRTAASIRGFQRALLAAVASLPGVRAAALGTDLPLEFYDRRTVAVEGRSLAADVPRNANASWLRGPYFETLGIGLVRGRLFAGVEDEEPRHVVVVNERLAEAFWPEQDPLGKRIRWGLDVPQNRNPWLTVVGVVRDVADGPIGAQPYLHLYEPFSQFPDAFLDNTPIPYGRHVELAVRALGDPVALVPEVRRELALLDEQLAIESIGTMEDRMAAVVAPRRFSAATLAAFAAGALLLAAVGLYGLLAYSVTERRREIAVRLALGAEPGTIVGMIVRQGLTLVGAGLAAGVVASFVVARAVASLLYRTQSHDLVTFGAVPMVLVLFALVACALPAWRASRVEPLAALRAE